MAINKIETGFDGLFLLESPNIVDERGQFKKILNTTDFEILELDHEFKELYYSVNKKDVIRGMHFQIPPKDHIKMVYCVSGRIIDICLDIRNISKTFGKFFSICLDGKDSNYLYIPKGFAHGFLAIEENSIVHYAQSSCYDKKCDYGLRYDSFGYNWGLKDPILSERDLKHPLFKEFVSPF